MSEGDGGTRWAIEDGRGHRYPVREIAAKLLDTIVRTLVVVGILYLIAGLWAIFT